ncbi:hypothetical protein [Pseudaminobacter soli (ex Li et al. 2025)]|uniref:Uncharacterized protein n=1 Tax=Pseudaminobacter soli (ex Li et al. 2025) TaxID=1295366 RepID=A0A2P7SNZ4_9HYPH|nr:hypothetical protein [Mesorhizobium soli]PSJ64105.1 hypothetical protein C7I85_03105 [Mesorhizobium soli]
MLVTRRFLVTHLIALAALAAVFQFQFASVAGASAKKATNEVSDFLQPMQFIVVRSSSPVCEPTCPQWIWANGEIVGDTPQQFQRLLKTIGKQRLPVVINSPGGNVDAAMKLARMIRGRGLDTAVGTAVLTGCPPERKDCLERQRETGVYLGVILPGICASACPLMLAGGVERLAGEISFVGVHQITTTVSREQVLYRERYQLVNGKKRVTERKIVKRKKLKSYKTTKLAKQTRMQMLAFLKEMGISQSYLAVSQATSADDMRQLTWMELLDLKLITGFQAPESLVQVGRCLELPSGENCIDLPDAGSSGKDDKTALEPEGSMHFVVVRSAEPGCEPNCPEWIAAEGLIDSRAPERLEKLLKGMGKRRLPLVLSSSGGNLAAAMALGRLVRKAELTTVVGSTVIDGCLPSSQYCGPNRDQYVGSAVSSGGRCVFGCVLVLAGGTQRLAGYQTAVAWSPPSALSNNTRFAVTAYLDEMGVLPAVLEEKVADSLDSDSQQRLYTQQLLTSTNLTVDSVVDGDICRQTPRPANCDG